MDREISLKNRVEHEGKREFLRLTPMQRIRKMNKIFNDIVALKAKTRGVKEYEIYRRYLKSR